MELKTLFIQDAEGNISPGANCFLYQVGTSSLVTEVYDKAGAPLSNPFPSDIDGMVQFATLNGRYDLRCVAEERDRRIQIQFMDSVEVLGRLLAPRAVAPTIRDTGEALQEGDQYPNTTDHLVYSWNGASWFALNQSVVSLTAALADPADPNKGAGMVGRTWQVFKSITDMRAFKKTSASKYAETLDFRSTAKGGAALYYYDASDISSDESIPLIIVADDGSRLKLNHNGTISPKQAGAYGDGINSDSPAFNAIAAATGRICVTEPGWYLLTEQIPIPVMDKLEISGTVVGAGLKVSLPNGGYLVNNSAASGGDTQLHVHDLNIDCTNVNSNVFKIVSTIRPVIFENLYLQNANNLFEFDSLFSHPTIRNVVARSIGSGQAGAFVLKATNCNTLVVDGLSCTGSWGAGIQLYPSAGGNENYSQSLKRIIVQGTVGNKCGRAIYIKGGSVSIEDFYVEQTSALDTVYLEDMKMADLRLMQVTEGSVYAKNSNITSDGSSYLVQAGNVSQFVSENSNVVISNFSDLNNYLFRFERKSSGKITVNGGVNRSSNALRMGNLGNGGAYGAATVVPNGPLVTAGLAEAYNITVAGQPAGFNNGMTMYLPNTATLPAGTELTAIIRVNKTSGAGVRVQTVAGDYTAVYPLPVTSYQTDNGWHDLVIHLKSVATGFSGNLRVTLDGDGACTVIGRLYLGWVTP